MLTRRFGRSGHMSTVAIFGAAAFGSVDQDIADATVKLIGEHGLNHIDVAPSYGRAEERLGPWMPKLRERFFLGCKTQERSREGAAAELRRSLERLQVKAFDLFQLHAVTTMAQLDEATRPGGALDAVREAREQGLTRYIGITGHGVESPAVFREALNRFDFDSVLFPVNFVQWANPVYRENGEALLKACRDRDIGVMAIKSITKAPWGTRAKTATTWYEPFTDPARIQAAVNFTLSQPGVTGICTVGDTRVLPLVLNACEHFSPLSPAEQEALIATAGQFEPLFA